VSAGPRRTPISGRLKKQLLLSKRQQKRCESVPHEPPDTGPGQSPPPSQESDSHLPEESYLATVRAVKRERRARAACRHEAARSLSPEEPALDGDEEDEEVDEEDEDEDEDEEEDEDERNCEVAGISASVGIFSVLAHEDEEGEESKSGQEHEHQVCGGGAMEGSTGSDCEKSDDDDEEREELPIVNKPDHQIEFKSQEGLPTVDEDAPSRIGGCTRFGGADPVEKVEASLTAL